MDATSFTSYWVGPRRRRCFQRGAAPVVGQSQSRRAGRGGSCLVETETETAVDMTSMWLSVATHRLYTP